MTDEHVQIIRRDWTEISDRPNTVCWLLFNRLFALCPELRPRFPGIMILGQLQLFSRLGEIIEKLDDDEALAAETKRLAIVCQRIDITDQHLAATGESLVYMLSRTFNTRWTDESQDAWMSAYDEITRAILAGMEGKDEA